MSHRIAAATGAAVVVGAFGLAALATRPASASARTHVERFHAHATAQLMTGAKSFVLAEQDAVGSTVIGHDVLFCRAASTHSTCSLAFATRGGLIYTRFRITDSDRTLHGSVTGGAGRYAGARGTISGRMVSASDVSVTLRYQD